MERTEQESTMNTATYEALRAVGATEEQAVVIATAIPDTRLLQADIERHINTQTKWIVGLLLANSAILVTMLGFFIASSS